MSLAVAFGGSDYVGGAQVEKGRDSRHGHGEPAEYIRIAVGSGGVVRQDLQHVINATVMQQAQQMR